MRADLLWSDIGEWEGLSVNELLFSAQDIVEPLLSGLNMLSRADRCHCPSTR